MAEEKKDAKPADKPEAPKPDPFVEIVWLILSIMILIYALNGILSAISGSRLLSSGSNGFTERGIWLSHTKPISYLENPIGAKVISLDKTDVLDSPGGHKIGEQKAGSRGKILQGPVEIDDVRYWYVDYDSGKDGWVKESDVAYLESEPSFIEKVILWFLGSLWLMKLLLIIFCIICVLFIAYMIRGLTRLRMDEAKLLYPENLQQVSDVNPEWERILVHIDSSNENDWRLAILEADIMLDNLLNKLSLPGETIGEKLKAVEKSDFITIDNAWEAHKVRNQVAHEGQSFVLTQREAKRVIDLYGSVFEEFQLI